MNTNRNQIFEWLAQGHIKKHDINKSLTITQSNNNPKQWYDFISKLLLSLSVLAIAAGVIFFFAYNWSEISTFAKFALIQGLIVVTIFIYLQTENYSLASTSALFFLALLIGALFALFGQTYQTGKDPWQLFFMWSLFVLPLAFVSRSTSLWLLWLALSTLSLNLLLDVQHSFFGVLLYNQREILLYALLGVISAVGFELLYIMKPKRLNSRVVAQVALVATMVAFTWVSIYSTHKMKNNGIDLLLYLTWMGAVFYIYRLKLLDVLVLSSWVISVIIFIVYLVSKTINGDLNGGLFLIISILTIGLSTLGGKWLMSLLKEANQAGESP